MRRWMSLGSVVVVAVSLLGCSDDEKPVPESRSVTTTAKPVTGADGSKIAAADLDALSARIEEHARTAQLDAATANQLRTIMLRSIGLSAEQATCVLGHIPPNTEQPVGAVTLMSAIPPQALTSCVDPATLQPNLSPDLSAVPADELRSALSGVLTAVWLDTGLERKEVECMVEATVDSMSDDELRGFFQRPDPAAGLSRQAVGGCLTKSRVDALNEG